MNPPLAFFLTFRTYGTWLHGDHRGSIDDNHKTFSFPLAPRNDFRADQERNRMKHPAMHFDASNRALVEKTIREACEYYKWYLVTLTVRSNHVHLIVGYAQLTPEQMAGKIKSRVTRMLREKQQLNTTQPVWAEGAGSRKYLWNERDVANAARYIDECQDERHA